MFSRSITILLFSLGIISNLGTDDASAQIGRRMAYRAARVEARARNLANRIVLRRQAVLGLGGAVTGQPPVASAPGQAPPAQQPSPATPQSPALTPSPVEQTKSAEAPVWNPSRPLPIGVQWEALGNRELLSRWRDVTSQFHRELDTLSTAAGWHRYLGMQENSSDPASSVSGRMDVVELQKLLERFDRVSVNPEYQKVSRLPSFAANHTALEEIVSRFAGPQLKEPKENTTLEQVEQSPVDTVETLPVPQPESKKPQLPNGERSILKNS